MERLESLKMKYQKAIDAMPELGFSLKNLHVENDKLVLKAHAPSEDLKNEFWNKVKECDSAFGDLNCEILVDSSLPQPAPKAVVYTVVAGDSLWKIAEKHWGNGSKYPEIIKANPGKLKDDKSVIHPGDELLIPNLG